MRASWRWLPPVLCLAAAELLVGPVAIDPGWPHNHEYTAPFERVEALRRAFVALDFAPTWTPFSYNGHGSPEPLIYHRLFSCTGGLLAVPLGSDLATRLTFILFAWLGAWGLYRCARRLDVLAPIAFAMACAFIWAPYSLTDWLVRGSAAEFAAMMLVPWLLEASLRQLGGERAWLAMGLWLGLSLHAHQSVGLFLAVLPLVSTLIALARPGSRTRAQVLGDALKAAGLALGLTLPWVLAIVHVKDGFQLDKLGITQPWNEFVAWRTYVMDDTFRWGERFQGLSVELSRWVLAAGVAGAALFVLSGARLRYRREALLVGLVMLGAAFLQLEVSAPAYHLIPRAELLQFPWRLLSLLTPLACLALGVLLSSVATQGPGWLGAALLLALGVVGGHAGLVQRAQAVDYLRTRRDSLRQKIEQLDGPWSWREYLPVQSGGVPVRGDWVSGCQVKTIDPPEPRHFTRIEVELEPGPACRLTFSQFRSPILVVEGDGRADPSTRMIEVDVPEGGRHVTVRRRGLCELAFGELR